MKRFLAYLAVLFVTTASYAQKAIIIGNGPGLKDSLDVTLFHKQGQTGTMKATTRIQNGSFRLTVPVDSGLMETILCVFNPVHPTLARTIYLRPGAKVEIDAADHRIETWLIRSDVPEQKSYDVFITASKELMDLLQDERVNYSESLYNAGTKARRDSIQKAYNDRESFRDSLRIEIDKRDVALLRDNVSADVVWWGKMESLARNYQYYDHKKWNASQRHKGTL